MAKNWSLPKSSKYFLFDTDGRESTIKKQNPFVQNKTLKGCSSKQKFRTYSFGTDSTIGIRDSAIDLILITKAAHAHPN